MLLAKRRATNAPDASYDLNGDGVVDQKDYLISRAFDSEKKNYLTSDEKEKAINAIKNGLEKQYLFVGNTNASHHRILQKRGKILISDDFSPIEQTYPKHPLSYIKPHNQTQADLRSRRRMMNQSELKSLKDQWDINNPQYIVYKQPVNEFLVKNPKYLFDIGILQWHR